jgi:ArsR family transcriptional regulator
MGMTTAAAHPLTRPAQLFHALSDEARLQIIAILLDGEHCVCDLMTHIDAAQSRLSYHLKVLKDAGRVSDRREGRWSYYTLQRDVFLEAEELLSALRPKQGRQPRASCC